MKIDHIVKVEGGQDGAIYGKYIFRFDHTGECLVYSTDIFEGRSEDKPYATFKLDKADILAPHSNAVVFGNEFYSSEDEFPILYTNIYNNYCDDEDTRCGTLCAYRVVRKGNSFETTLLQIIEVAFTDQKGLWRSEGNVTDIRPYGNFVIDAENSRIFAFVMRDADKTTRYFSFDLPKLADGNDDARYGAKRVKLNYEDVLSYFDVPYHNFVQGACFYDGKIYSVEGFNKDIHPAIRIIDPDLKKQTYFCDFYEAGYDIEAEFIDFYKGECIYGDAFGNYYRIEF